MKASHLRKYIIEPTLDYISLENLTLNSKNAIQIILGTAAQETHLGEYLHQIKGPAKGPYGMEPFTHECLKKDLYKKTLSGKKNRDKFLKLWHKVSNLYIHVLTDDENLIGNLYYTTAMTRIYYLQFTEPLPKAGDIQGMAAYWKKYYNTEKGKGTMIQFIENYKRLVLSDVE